MTTYAPWVSRRAWSTQLLSSLGLLLMLHCSNDDMVSDQAPTTSTSAMPQSWAAYLIPELAPRQHCQPGSGMGLGGALPLSPPAAEQDSLTRCRHCCMFLIWWLTLLVMSGLGEFGLSGYRHRSRSETSDILYLVRRAQLSPGC